MNHRVAITGGPRSGKTTLSGQFLDRGYTVKHTDDLIGNWDWSEASHQASHWFNLPGPLCIEGVAVPRALRKFLARCDAKPLDRLVILEGAMVPRNDRQAFMSKGIDTVLAEILPKLKARGVEIVTLPVGQRELLIP